VAGGQEQSTASLPSIEGRGPRAFEAGLAAAHVIEIDAGHDPSGQGEEYARLAKLAVDTAATAAGLATPVG
jgi:hypothetical protein